MNATTKPAPGSAAAVLDVAVHSVAEGRYRYARLHLLWRQATVSLDNLAELVNEASAVPELPPGLTTATIIETGRPKLLPAWLTVALDEEIARICAGHPVANATPTQLVARITAAVCIDVCADTHEASARVGADAEADSVDEAGHHRHRMIDFESSAGEVIDLGADQPADAGSPTVPPSGG